SSSRSGAPARRWKPAPSIRTSAGSATSCSCCAPTASGCTRSTTAATAWNTTATAAESGPQPSDADCAPQERERLAEKVEREADAPRTDLRGTAQPDPRLRLAAGEPGAHQVGELAVRARHRFIAGLRDRRLQRRQRIRVQV